MTYTPAARSSRRISAPFYIVRGARFLWDHPTLWKYAAAPIAISTTFLGLAYYVIYVYFSSFLDRMLSDQWYFQVLYYVVLVVTGALIVVVTFFIFTQIASTIAGPFNELISERVEAIVKGGLDETPFSVIQLLKDSTRGIAHAFMLLGLYLVFLVMGLVLFLIPGIGHFLYTVIMVSVSSYMLAYEYLGYPMDRRRYTFGQKRAFLRSGLTTSLGFGLGNLAAASIPILNLLFIPAAVVGGTLLFLDIENEDGD